jgi:prephenate dehydrogenase
MGTLMKLFDKITIIGVGLIGGSIGLAARRRRVAREVTGVFRRRSTMVKALRAGAVDDATMDIARGVIGADLIIVASPVGSIPELALEAARYAKPGAIITDVGSTKAWIAGRMERCLRGTSVRFVGSHPMAGSEKTGVLSAREDLLEGSACIVTRTASTDAAALRRVAALWKALGARVSVLSPDEHDRAVSFVSHLPHIVAFALALSVPEGQLRYAAEGFRDTTRVASSDPALWSDIFLTNRKEIARSAAAFRRCYDAVVRAVVAGRRPGTMKALSEAKGRRDRFMKRYAKKR